MTLIRNALCCSQLMANILCIFCTFKGMGVNVHYLEYITPMLSTMNDFFIALNSW